MTRSSTFVAGLLLLLGCDDNDEITPVVTVEGASVRVEWHGTNVDTISVGESRGASADAECDSGQNVWWARQSTPGPPRIASPVIVGETPRDATTSTAPTLSKGKRYIVSLDRHERGERRRASGCAAFER